MSGENGFFVVSDDRLKELKAFDETKAGVKGLLDAGITSLPKIFIRPTDDLRQELAHGSSPDLQIPLIDLGGGDADSRRPTIVRELKEASEKFGIFNLVNHGIPSSVMEGMIDGIRRFHEQDAKLKEEWYTRDSQRKVQYVSNSDLYQSEAANWRDTIKFALPDRDEHLRPHDFPSICREATIEYINHLMKVGETLLELLSEALGLEQDHLKSIECVRRRFFSCHYYPPCPEPDLTLGTSKHTDPCFVTILLQSTRISALQALHDHRWIDVEPIEGALVVNIGDFLEIASNGKFKSAVHRVIASRVGPRISVACFFNGAANKYGPIRELIPEEESPKYKDFLLSDYLTTYFSGPIRSSVLDEMKV